MDVSNKEVKDAAEALAVVLKEVTLAEDPNSNKELQGTMNTIVDSLENLISVITEISAISNQNLDEKMETVNQHLTSIKDGIDLSIDNKLEPLEDRMNSCAVINKHLFALSQQLMKNEIESMKNSKNIFGDEMVDMNHHLGDINDEMTRKSIRDINEDMKHEMICMTKRLQRLESDFSTVKKDISAVKTLLEAEEKHKKAEFQISCAELKSFNYYDYGSSEKISSEALVRKYLKQFALGKNRFKISSKNRTSKGRENFRDRLKEQLEYIMGRELTIVTVTENVDGEDLYFLSLD